MKISLCITTYNRSDLTVESFSRVYDHPRIDEVVIVDDCSEIEHFNKLQELLLDKKFSLGKILLYRNEENLNMSRNKAKAISYAKNSTVIILDSDNILYPEYVDNIPMEVSSSVIYCPDFAEPDYDFRRYSEIDKHNAKGFLGDKEFRILLNTCNYVVNRDEYLRVYRYDPEIKESDTIHFNALWLEAGNSFMVVPGIRYYHRRHAGSGWLMGDHEYNLRKAAEIQDKIKTL